VGIKLNLFYDKKGEAEMSKRIVALFTGLAVVFLIFTWMPAYTQEDMVSLADNAFRERQRPPAEFVHDQHNEKAEVEECNLCHHLYQNGVKVEDESSEDQECSACHKIKVEDNVRPLMKAYHDLCKGCHREKKAGPATCGECHQRGGPAGSHGGEEGH
jgi:hypothetical protein